MDAIQRKKTTVECNPTKEKIQPVGCDPTKKKKDNLLDVIQRKKEKRQQLGVTKGKRNEEQAVSAIIRESGAFWERPKRTGVKRRVKA